MSDTAGIEGATATNGGAAAGWLLVFAVCVVWTIGCECGSERPASPEPTESPEISIRRWRTTPRYRERR